jgi:hypothetical protein
MVATDAFLMGFFRGARRLHAVGAGACRRAALRLPSDLAAASGVKWTVKVDARYERRSDEGNYLVFEHRLLGSAAYELPLPDEQRRIHAQLAARSGDRAAEVGLNRCER